MRRGIGKERLENERCQRKETQNLDERQDISADTCLPQGPMCSESTGVWVRGSQNETRLILSIFWFGKPPHTHRYAHARTHTHTFTHTHTHTYNLLEQSSYSRHCLHPRGEPGAMEVAETASHLQMFFFSQKSWSLISVLSKPTTQHHYSDFLLLPMNLPFIHCLKKKKTKTICSFPNPHTTYPNASFSSSSDSLLWLPSSLLGSSLLTSFHNVHLPQSNCYGPSLMWY